MLQKMETMQSGHVHLGPKAAGSWPVCQDLAGPAWTIPYLLSSTWTVRESVVLKNPGLAEGPLDAELVNPSSERQANGKVTPGARKDLCCVSWNAIATCRVTSSPLCFIHGFF